MSMMFARLVDGVLNALRPYVLFTTLNTVWRYIEKGSSSILDVGCGKGQVMKFINRNKRFYTVGVDIFEPYIEHCRASGIHDDYIMGDIRELAFEDKSFDTVLCLETIEHLGKREGLKVLQKLEKIARKQVIVSMPVGKYRQEAEDNNPFQKHRSVWHPREMKKLGYEIRGCGLRFIGNIPRGQSVPLKTLFILANILWVMVSPLAYYFPNFGGDMVCVKNFRPEHSRVRLLERLRFYRGALTRNIDALAAAHWEQFAILKNTLFPICGEIKNKKILDIGCGRLYPNTLLLSDFGNDVVGVDTAYIGIKQPFLKRCAMAFRHDGAFSFMGEIFYFLFRRDKKYYAALEKLAGKRLAHDGVSVKTMNAERLYFPDETFDLVVSNATFEHICDVPKAVSEVARVLKKDGVIYIGINLFTSLAGGHCFDYKDQQKVLPWGHLRAKGHTAPVYLNKMRESEFIRLFSKRFYIIEVKDIGVGEGRAFLTPQVREELKDYSENELLKRDIIIVARKRN